ncbi:MAG: class I SAM-dependent methyltransferase [Planctomycetota bacterium]|nr:class I SAM-dependent methyltransferase [Planctomycetota bacterium]
MRETSVSEFTALGRVEMSSKGLAEMQQDLLADLYSDELPTECYQKLAEWQQQLTDPRDEIVQGAAAKIQAGITDFFADLNRRRSTSSSAEWNAFVKLCRLHPLRELLHQDPFTYRCFAKPRGYAGDATMLDYIYGVDEEQGPPEDTTDLGRHIFAATTGSTICEAVRARRRLVAEMIDRLALEIPRPKLLSIAAGHLREADLTGALKQRRLGRWVAFDVDTDSLQEVQKCYANHGVEAVAGSVRQLFGKRLGLGEFDFIYSTGLYDYLQQPIGKRLTERMYEMLRPGGQLLIANLLPTVGERGYMETYMDWHLTYRTHPQMLDLATSVDQTRIRDIRLLTEENQNIVFLSVTKK